MEYNIHENESDLFQKNNVKYNSSQQNNYVDLKEPSDTKILGTEYSTLGIVKVKKYRLYKNDIRMG